ncbi:unnamed protein product [Paramecium pentaurelia]|uniref:Transmembrane protein n=1 Tax=Paramecium pentaurelia TaxID=43138 RepID=A0A8S1THS9_9CILI|nr:unnamed protein product [Paramecium pentaurelia]
MNFAATLGSVACCLKQMIVMVHLYLLNLDGASQLFLFFFFLFGKGNQDFGGFLLFALINYLYFHFYLIDGRGKTNNNQLLCTTINMDILSFIQRIKIICQIYKPKHQILKQKISKGSSCKLGGGSRSSRKLR